MPETLIEPHKVLSPLPKQLPAVQRVVFEDEYEKTVKARRGKILEVSECLFGPSLDNLVTEKRRSKPVKPVKRQTKKRANKGGEN